MLNALELFETPSRKIFYAARRRGLWFVNPRSLYGTPIVVNNPTDLSVPFFYSNGCVEFNLRIKTNWNNFLADGAFSNLPREPRRTHGVVKSVIYLRAVSPCRARVRIFDERVSMSSPTTRLRPRSEEAEEPV